MLPHLSFLTIAMDSDAPWDNVSPSAGCVTGINVKILLQTSSYAPAADTGTVRRARTSTTARSSPPPVCPPVSAIPMTSDCARVRWGPDSVTTTCVWVTTSGATESQSAETRRTNPPRAPRVSADCPSQIQGSCVMESETVLTWRMKLQQRVSVRRRVGDATS